jgi:hypothetical protein
MRLKKPAIAADLVLEKLWDTGTEIPGKFHPARLFWGDLGGVDGASRTGINFLNLADPTNQYHFFFPADDRADGGNAYDVSLRIALETVEADRIDIDRHNVTHDPY